MEEPVQPNTPALTNCPQCNAETPSGKVFCNACGYPINGTIEQKSAYETDMFKLQAELAVAQRRVKTARNTLYVLAGITLFFGLIAAMMVGSNASLLSEKLGVPADSLQIIIIIAIIIGAALYIGLGYWSNKRPFAAFLTATILFSLSTISGVVRNGINPSAIFTLVIQVAIITALVYGTIGGSTIEKIKRKLNID